MDSFLSELIRRMRSAFIANIMLKIVTYVLGISLYDIYISQFKNWLIYMCIYFLKTFKKHCILLHQ
jgi:hypothetical protein